MIVRKPFPIPEEPPAVPPTLFNKVVEAIEGDLREVDVTIKNGSGYKIVNNVRLEKDDNPSDFAQMLKMCGDYDAECRGESGTYRLTLWIGGGKSSNTERWYYSFRAESPGDSQSGSTEELIAGWRALAEEKQTYTESVIQHNLALIASVNSRARSDATVQKDFHQVVRTLLGPYRDGIALKSESLTEVIKARAEAARERQRADNAIAGDGDDEFWEMMKPLVATAVQQVMAKGGEVLALPAAKGKDKPKRSNKIKSENKEKQATTQADARSSSETPAPQPLHRVGQALLSGLGTNALVRLLRVLDEEDAEQVELITSAKDDLTSAKAILTLMDSLLKQPAVLLKMQQIVGADRVGALRKIADVAKQVVARSSSLSQE